VADEAEHAVRIARPHGTSEVAPASGAVGRAPPSTTAPEKPSGTRSGRSRNGEGGPGWQKNRGGLERSWKLFLWGFFLAPLLLWAIFLGLVVTSPYSTVSNYNVPQYLETLLLTSIFLVAIILVGSVLTFGRTPRQISFDPGGARLRVVPYFGRAQSFRVSKDAYQATLELYPRGFLASEDTELVEVILPPWKPQRWVVERHLLDGALPRHPARKTSRNVRVDDEETDREDYASLGTGRDVTEETSERPRGLP
jgi:hypothetical protein